MSLFKFLSNQARGILNISTSVLRKKRLPGFLDYRDGLNNTSLRTLGAFGREQITEMYISRVPVSSIFITILNSLSFGLFKDLMEDNGFDKMFHLALIVVVNGKRIIIEKLAEINIDTEFENTPAHEYQKVWIDKRHIYTIDSLLFNTKRQIGNELFYDYDAFTNNCQNFIRNILSVNGLLTDENNNFLYQDIEELYNSLKTRAPYLQSFAKTTTRTGVLYNKLIGEGGLKGDVLEKKKYPLNYSNQAVDIIDMMVFNPKNAEILGSMGFKSSEYAGDYDIYETVKISSFEALQYEFIKKIQRLNHSSNVFVGDIKIGVDDNLKIIDEDAYFKNNKLIGYNQEQSKQKLHELYKVGIISRNDYYVFNKYLVENPSRSEWNKIKKAMRIHIIRFTQADILKGFKMLGTRKITLLEALKMDGLFKLDVIGYADGRFMEFSIIYDLRDQNMKRLNNYRVNIVEGLKENIELYKDLDKHFKVIKRVMSLKRYLYLYRRKSESLLKDIENINDILNGELGLLYSVLVDCETLLTLLEDDNINTVPYQKMINQMDGFITRLANIYSMPKYKKIEKNIIDKLKDCINEKDFSLLKPTLKDIIPKLSKILNDEAKPYTEKILKS